MDLRIIVFQCSARSRKHRRLRFDLVGEPRQRRTLVHSNVIGLVTSDFILRFILAGVNRVSPELRASRDHTNDSTANAARFRIPAHMIAYLEPTFRHL